MCPVAALGVQAYSPLPSPNILGFEGLSCSYAISLALWCLSRHPQIMAQTIGSCVSMASHSFCLGLASIVPECGTRPSNCLSVAFIVPECGICGDSAASVVPECGARGSNCLSVAFVVVPECGFNSA